MSRELEELVEKARTIEMTPEQLREQRRSFVYGNTHIENQRITRELVAEVDEELSATTDSEVAPWRGIGTVSRYNQN
jgi:hypothetical protein